MSFDGVLYRELNADVSVAVRSNYNAGRLVSPPGRLNVTLDKFFTDCCSFVRLAASGPDMVNAVYDSPLWSDHLA
tara:strand:- start:787 stop:1011 length:225 start_codon:yes stop_codon:yes gene_type:complete